MKNKKVITCLVAAALVGTIGIGATLAYLQDSTEVITNTFTIGDVEIDLDEPSWDPDDAEDMKPGATVDKNPLVTNVGQTDAFIGVSVTGVEAMAEEGFVIGESGADGKLALKDDKNVFEWDADFTLVDNKGAAIAAGNDDGLTLAELQAIAGDKLYFAYEKPLATGDQTPALFDAVKLTTAADAVSTYQIEKHFTDASGNILTPVDGVYASEPHKENGKYVYACTVKNADGDYIVYDDTNKTYSVVDDASVTDINAVKYANDSEETAYDKAAKAVDAMEAADDTNTIEFNMNIKAAAIQSANDEAGADWEKIDVWYKLLPEEFLAD